jgi:hypothetical protein
MSVGCVEYSIIFGWCFVDYRASLRGEEVSWLPDTFSEITSIVKYNRASLMCHSLRGMVKVQVFIVVDFWKGCNSIGAVNLKVPLLILKPCPSLDIQLQNGVVEEPLKGYTQQDL